MAPIDYMAVHRYGSVCSPTLSFPVITTVHSHNLVISALWSSRVLRIPSGILKRQRWPLPSR
jgi:hypothetical protein